MHDECKKSSADANVREINPSDRTNRSVAARIDTSSSTIAIMGTPGTCPILDANNQWEQHRRRTAQLKCASKPRRKIILRFCQYYRLVRRNSRRCSYQG